MASDGIILPSHLPELEGHLCRPETEVVARLLCLHAVAAVAYGLPRQTALEWLNEDPPTAKSEIEEPSATLRTESCLRSSEEVLVMADLGYCLHWAMRESQLKNASLRSNPNPLVVEQRRRALEWLIGDNSWSETSLDT